MNADEQTISINSRLQRSL